MTVYWTRRTITKSVALGIAGSLLGRARAVLSAEGAGVSREFDISTYDSILLPREHGQLTSSLAPIFRRYPSRDHCMQMAAFFSAKKGLLVFSKDADGQSSDWAIYPRRKLRITFHGKTPEVEAVEIPPTIEAAAAVYREWALKQTWASWTKAHKNDFSWCVVASSPDSDVQGRYLDEIYADFPRPIGVWFTQYRRHAFDTMYPDYRARDEGGFGLLMRRARAAGAVALPYVNGLLWDQRLESFRAIGNRVAVRGRFGGLISYSNTLQDLCYACPASPEWREIIRKARGALNDLDGQRAGGIYLDMVLATPPLVCWSDQHGHEPGDPNAWQQGIRELLGEMAGVVVSEGCAEVYLDKTSYALMHLYSQSSDSVPLWRRVYGAGPPSLGWSLPTDVSVARLQGELGRIRQFGTAAMGSPWMTKIPEQTLMTSGVRRLLHDELRRSHETSGAG
ncbi:MAG: hypothetical protein HRU81_07845 [Gammaproteobacteria bacterium]|nr:MAG: hypothetical protein HRU81_07845 [Gammaproteobacteria bacterium]